MLQATTHTALASAAFVGKWRQMIWLRILLALVKAVQSVERQYFSFRLLFPINVLLFQTARQLVECHFSHPSLARYLVVTNLCVVLSVFVRWTTSLRFAVLLVLRRDLYLTWPSFMKLIVIVQLLIVAFSSPLSWNGGTAWSGFPGRCSKFNRDRARGKSTATNRANCHRCVHKRWISQYDR